MYVPDNLDCLRVRLLATLAVGGRTSSSESLSIEVHKHIVVVKDIGFKKSKGSKKRRKGCGGKKKLLKSKQVEMIGYGVSFVCFDTINIKGSFRLRLQSSFGGSRRRRNKMGGEGV